MAVYDPRLGRYDINRAAARFPELLPGLVRNAMKIHLGEHYPSRDEAEECVMEAWLVFEQKVRAGEVHTEDSPGGWLNNATRFRVLRMLDRRMRAGEVSLEGFTEQLEAGEDSSRVLIDTHSEDAYSPERLELQRHPVLKLRADYAARDLRAPCRTGTATGKAKLTDEQVAEVRAKYAAGGVSKLALAREFGVSDMTIIRVCNGERRGETMEGWTRELVLDALRRWIKVNGRTPRVTDARTDPTLPSLNAIRHHCESWNEALRLVGAPDVHERPARWTDRQIAHALCRWQSENGRFPTPVELRDGQLAAIPSPRTIRRRIGTSTDVERIFRWAREHWPDASAVNTAIVGGGGGGVSDGDSRSDA